MKFSVILGIFCLILVGCDNTDNKGDDKIVDKFPDGSMVTKTRNKKESTVLPDGSTIGVYDVLDRVPTPPGTTGGAGAGSSDVPTDDAARDDENEAPVNPGPTDTRTPEERAEAVAAAARATFEQMFREQNENFNRLFTEQERTRDEGREREKVFLEKFEGTDRRFTETDRKIETLQAEIAAAKSAPPRETVSMADMFDRLGKLLIERDKALLELIERDRTGMRASPPPAGAAVETLETPRATKKPHESAERALVIEREPPGVSRDEPWKGTTYVDIRFLRATGGHVRKAMVPMDSINLMGNQLTFFATGEGGGWVSYTVEWLLKTLPYKDPENAGFVDFYEKKSGENPDHIHQPLRSVFSNECRIWWYKDGVDKFYDSKPPTVLMGKWNVIPSKPPIPTSTPSTSPTTPTSETTTEPASPIAFKPGKRTNTKEYTP